MPVLLPTYTTPLLTTGAVTKVPSPNSQRLGPPDGSTATRLPLCRVYMFLPSKAGAVSEANVPTWSPEDFARMIGVLSGRNPRAYREVSWRTAVLPPPPPQPTAWCQTRCPARLNR